MRNVKLLTGILSIGALLVLGTGDVARALNLQYVDSALWTRARDCDLQGDTLAVAVEYGVQLWDIADETAPDLLGEHYLDTFRAYALERSGEILAVTTLQQRLVILDVSDPSAPVELATVDGIGTSPDVALREQDDTLYAFTGGNTDQDGLRVYDLGDPANPTLVGSADLSGLESVALSGDTVFALAAGAGLYSLDISDLGAPSVLGTALPVGSYANVSAQDTLVAVAANNAGFYVIGASDPANMNVLAQVSPTVNEDFDMLRVKEIILDGTLLYAITDYAGPLVYDITDPADPVLVGYDVSLDGGPPPPYVTFYDGDLVDGRLVASHWDSQQAGMLIFDVAGLDPAFVARAPMPDYTRYVGAGDSLLFACNGESGVTGFSVDPGSGALIERDNLQLTEAYGVDAHGDLAYVASTSDGLVITDWSDPDSAVVLSSVPVGQARDVGVVYDEAGADTLAYVAAFTQGIHIVDVGDPHNPVELGDTDGGGVTVRLDVEGDLLASADLAYGMNLYDVSDPTAIQHLGNWPVDGRAVDVLLYGDYAFVVEEGDSVHIVNVSNPQSPAQKGVFHYDVGETEDYDPQGLALVNGQLLVASGGEGVFSYDIATALLAPTVTDTLDTPGTAYAVFGKDGRLLVADDSGLLLAVYGETAAPVAPAPGFALSAYPNPFNPHTTLRFDLAAAAELAVDVFDVSGRRLRTLATGPREAGVVRLSWDGRDGAGRELASGVYLARLSGRELGSGRALDASRKLVLIR